MRRDDLVEREGWRDTVAQNALLERAIDGMDDMVAPRRIQFIDEEELEDGALEGGG